MDIAEIMELTPAELNQLALQIGNTPIHALDLLIHGSPQRIYLKLEGANPTGSMKDRTAYALVRQAEEQGLLTRGGGIVESTSGNLGVALAFLCRARGYHFIGVIDPKTTRENILKMRTLGAKLEMVEQPDCNGGYLYSRIARVQELCRLYDHYIWTNQYENPANFRIHYSRTGPEIYQQMQGNVDVIFAPVSTGGTLAGIGQFFREKSPSTRIIGVDAHGSVIFGTPPGPRLLTGIGSSRPSSFLSENLYDEYMLARDEEAFACCRSLSAETGIKVGGSSGAVLSACRRYLQTHPNPGRVVCVCADRGENYASSIFNDEWIREKHLNLPQISLTGTKVATGN